TERDIKRERARGRGAKQCFTLAQAHQSPCHPVKVESQPQSPPTTYRHIHSFFLSFFLSFIPPLLLFFLSFFLSFFHVFLLLSLIQTYSHSQSKHMSSPCFSV